MKLTSLITPVALLLAISSPAFAETKSYNVSDFDMIDISMGLSVEFETGPAHSVIVENEEGAWDKIIVKVKGDRLVLKRPNNLGWGGNKEQFLIRVTAPELSELEASSGSSASGGGLSGEAVEIRVSSGASASVSDISAGDIKLKTSSGASLSASGECKDLIANASSGASISAERLVCKTIKAKASSGASISGHATDAVDASASSGGSITASGGAPSVKKNKSLSGSISVSP